MALKLKSLLSAGMLLFTMTSALKGVSRSDEPPVNPWLADSPWPMTHRNPYQQASSPLPGPDSSLLPGKFTYRFTGQLVNITMAVSSEYPDGGRVYWGSNAGYVYKVMAGSDLEMIHKVSKPPLGRSFKPGNAVSGAYSLVDRDNRYYTVFGNTVLVYGDKYPSDIRSPMYLMGTLTIPDEALTGGAGNDPIVGLNMTWDGHVVIATKRGTVGIISREMELLSYRRLSQIEGGEEISNSIAVDEKGGIYVVSRQKMHKLVWNGSNLSADLISGAWTADYDTGENQSGNGRLGSGSGSTPTLMGTGDQDKFVVITDGNKMTKLTLFWRDEIPEGWQPVAPGKDIRIAGEMTVDYGDPDRTSSASEQSVLVRGYDAVVVSNDYRNVGAISGTGIGDENVNAITSGIIAGISNWPLVRPWGVQKFRWNPELKKVEKVWSNLNISCPNGVPTMSSASNLFYCWGSRRGGWTLEALNWDTGKQDFYRFIGFNPMYNSFYAALQIGENSSVASGALSGVMELR